MAYRYRGIPRSRWIRTTDETKFANPSRVNVKRWIDLGHWYSFKKAVRASGVESVACHAVEIVRFLCRRASVDELEQVKIMDTIRLFVEDLHFDVNTPVPLGNHIGELKATALFLFSRRFLPKIVEQLLSYGANPNHGGTDGSSPLQGACAELVRNHCANKLCIEHSDKKVRLKERKRRGFEVLQLLCKAGANVNYADGFGMTPLLAVMVQVHEYDVKVQQDSATKYHRNQDAHYLLKHSTAVVKFLIERRACPHTPYGDGGDSALHLAVRCERHDLVDIMMEATCGCRRDALNALGKDQQSLLELSIQLAHPEFVNKFMTAGASMTGLSSEEKRPLSAMRTMNMPRMADEGYYYYPRDEADVSFLTMMHQSIMLRTFYTREPQSIEQDVSAMSEYSTLVENTTLQATMCELGLEVGGVQSLYTAALHKNVATLECMLLKGKWSDEEIANALELNAAVLCTKARSREMKDIVSAKARFRRALAARERCGVPKVRPRECSITVFDHVVKEADTEAELDALLSEAVWSPTEEQITESYRNKLKKPEAILAANVHQLLVYQRLLPAGHLSRRVMLYDIVHTLYTYDGKHRVLSMRFSLFDTDDITPETNQANLILVEDCYRLYQQMFEEELAALSIEEKMIHPHLKPVSEEYVMVTKQLLKESVVVDTRTFFKWVVQFWPNYHKRRKRKRRESKDDPNPAQSLSHDFVSVSTELLVLLCKYSYVHADIEAQANFAAKELAELSHRVNNQPTVLHELVKEHSYRRFRDYEHEHQVAAIRLLLHQGVSLDTFNDYRQPVVFHMLVVFTDDPAQRRFWKEQQDLGLKKNEIPDRRFLTEDGVELMKMFCESGLPIHWDLQDEKFHSTLSLAQTFPQLDEIIAEQIQKYYPAPLQCLCARVVARAWDSLPWHILPRNMSRQVRLHYPKKRDRSWTPSTADDGDHLDNDFDEEADGRDADVGYYYYALLEDEDHMETGTPI